MSLVLLCVISICMFRFILKKFRLYQTGWHIPGPWAVPFIGNVQMISKLKPQYLFSSIIEYRARFKCTYRLWLGPQLWVFLYSPEETRDALNNATLVKPDTFKQLNVLLGNGLLVSEGKHWQTHRRLLGPAFQPNILYSLIPAIAGHAAIFLQKLRNTRTQSVEVSEYLFPCILDAVIDTSMGKQLNSQNDVHNRYTHAFHRASELLFKRMMNPLLAPDFIFKRTNIRRDLQESLDVIFELMEGVIRERAAFLKENERIYGLEADNKLKSKGRPLLDILLNSEIDGEKLSFEDVRDEVNTFVFAGVDTTTAAMSFILYALAKFPEEQAKVYSEIRSLLPTDSAPSIEELNNLIYLDMFIKESMRYYTIVPMTGRKTTTNTKIGSIHYCVGVTVWVNMYGLAHDATLFEEPDEFRPERFSKENADRIPAFAYIPFSGGPHVCIGKKYALLIMKILTVRILQNFEIYMTNPEEELVLMAQMVLKSLNGINLKFIERI